MTLLQEIQRDAIDGHADLATLLRKCRVLAVRLKNEEFKSWVQYELDGYPSGTALPDYRISHAQSLGHFVGPWGSGARNAPIPFGCIPEEYHEQVRTVQFREGIGALSSIAAKATGKSLQEHWPADLVAVVGRDIFENMTLMQAWKVISPATISGILDTVRNRVLNFVLEVEAESPEAGEASGSTALSTERVGNFFATYIMGNVTNLATGSTGVHQTGVAVVRSHDIDSLKVYLLGQGVAPSDMKELEVALTDEPALAGGNLGSRVSGWIGKMVSKAAQGVWNVSTTVAADVLSKAVTKFYGLE